MVWGVVATTTTEQWRGGMGRHGPTGCSTFGAREIEHRCLKNCCELMQSLLESLETIEWIRREEHVDLVATLDKMHYFQCQVRERLVVVWRGQNLLSEKVEKLES